MLQAVPSVTMEITIQKKRTKERKVKKERQEITLINRTSFYTHICLFAEPEKKKKLQFFYHNA